MSLITDILLFLHRIINAWLSLEVVLIQWVGVESWISMSIVLADSWDVFVHLFEHLLEVEEEVEDSCRVEENFDHLAGCRALDQIFVHVDQVVNSAQKEHDAIKATAVGPLRLIASEDKYQSRDWQGDYDEPLRNLLHDHAIIVYQKNLLLDIDATFLFIIDPVCQQSGKWFTLKVLQICHYH